MDFLNSFFQNIKDKITSPFFGTLSLILIIHHWEFWYTLFNFDKDCTRTEKLATLRLIATNEFGNYRILGDIGLAFLIMLIGYAVVMLTRTLALTIDFRFMPWVTGKVISSKVVERSLHESVVAERNDYSEKYEEQRKSVRNLSKDYDFQTEQIQEKNATINDQLASITTLQKANSELEKNLSTENTILRALKTEKNKVQEDNKRISETLDREHKRIQVYEENTRKLLTVLIPNDSVSLTERKKIPTTLTNLAHKIKTDGNWRSFLIYVDFERHGGSMNSEITTKMKAYGLAGNDDHERITPLGQILAAYIPILDDPS